MASGTGRNADKTPEAARRRGFIVGTVGYGLFLSWMWIVYFSNFTVSHAGMNSIHAIQLRITMLVALALALPVLGLCERFLMVRRGIVATATLSILLCPLASLAALFFPCTCTGDCAFFCTCSGMLVQDVAWALSGLGYAFLMVYWSWFIVALSSARNQAFIIGVSMVVSSALFFVATLFLPAISMGVHALLPLCSVACSVYSHRLLVGSIDKIAIKRVAPSEALAARRAKLSKRTVIMTWFSGIALGFAGFVVTSSDYVVWADLSLSALLLVASLGLLALVKRRQGMHYRDVLWLYVPIVVFCLIPMSVVGSMGRVLLACLLIALLTAYSFVDLNALVQDVPRIAPHVTKTVAFGRLGNVIGMVVGWATGGVVDLFSAAHPALFGYVCLGLVMVLVAASTYMFNGIGGMLTVVASSPDAHYEGQCQAFARRYGLTPRQLDVLRLLGRGRTAISIQERLSISESTAKTHIYAIYQKAGIHTQRELLDLLDATEPEDDPDGL